MKVLFLTNIPSPYRVEFFNELSKNVDLTVVFYDSLNNYKHRNENWFKLNDYLFNSVFLQKEKKWFGKKIKYDVKEWLLKKWDFIIIGGYSIPTAMYAIQFLKSRHIKFLMELDGGKIKKEPFINYIIKKHFISSASAWLITSEQTLNYVLHYGAKKEKCYIYPFTSITNKDLLESERRIKEDNVKEIKSKLNMIEEKIIISVGRFTYKNGYGKGFDVLLECATYLKQYDYGIYIIGDEPTEEFKSKTLENNLTNVHYVSFLSKDDLSNYYLVADLFVLLTRGDVWGLVINEAMSYKLPVITTYYCTAGLELCKDDVNGYLVDLNDINNIVNKIIYILNNEEICNKFGSASFEKIKNYTIESMVNSHLQIFNLMESGHEKELG